MAKERKAGAQGCIVKQIDDAGMKREIARTVLESLPEWFERQHK